MLLYTIRISAIFLQIVMVVVVVGLQVPIFMSYITVVLLLKNLTLTLHM